MQLEGPANRTKQGLITSVQDLGLRMISALRLVTFSLIWRFETCHRCPKRFSVKWGG